MRIEEELARLAALDRDLEPPPGLEEAVWGRLKPAASFSSPARRGRVPVWLALAASLLAGAVLLHRPAPASRPAERPFSQIPYVVPPAPYERTRVLRMDVPVAALIAAGFEVHTADTGAALPADVLVGQDGRALALRLVTNSDRRID